jgi:cytochrome c-type biogenesis protein CcmE
MKKVYIVAIAMVVVAIAVFVNSASDMSTYSSFTDANQEGKKVKVVGQLAKDKTIVYDPLVDPNVTSFYVRDNDGVEKKVVLLKAKPQDFELSEQVVLTGKMKDDEFIATDILMKCPSKYKDEELYVKSEKG